MSPHRSAATGHRRLVLLTPIEPAVTGNGLAMRAELFRRSAPTDLRVQTVVVPVAGHTSAPRCVDAISVPADVTVARVGARALAADPTWRERLARAGPLPALSRAASPGLADAVVAAIGGGGPVALHVIRAYMAPLGAAVAERVQAPWITLDLDEDDAAFARSAGDLEGAAAYERLLDVFGPLYDRLSAASAHEAAALGERHGLAIEHLPNAVQLVARPPRRAPTDGQRAPVLLFVGNLTYPPNVEAVDLLVHAILPAVNRRLGRRVRVTLVGPHDGGLDRLRGADVEVAGFVPDLDAVYASADVVVVPLRSGAGTRIKLLEAFAHAVPVVASAAAAAGLEVTHGRHLLIADDPNRAATAIHAVLTDESLAARLVDESSHLVRERYCVGAVTPTIRDFFARAAAERRPQPSVP